MTDQIIDVADLPDDTRDGNAADSDFIDKSTDEPIDEGDQEPIDGADEPDTGVDGADDPVNENLPDDDDE